MKSQYLLHVALVLMLVGCHGGQTGHDGAVANIPAGLAQPKYLHEVMRYLYRWHLTEDDVETLSKSKNVTFWIRAVHPKLDAGDRSRLAEISVPQVGIQMIAKKADYTIEETGDAIRSNGYKIIDVRHEGAKMQRAEDAAVVELDAHEMIDFIFKTRGEHDFPSPDLIQHMRMALREEAAKQGILPEKPIEQPVVYLSPLCPVANEVWVFWESGRKLFCFSSEHDLAETKVWDKQEMTVQIYDLDDQVVLSHEESPGSGRFLTRHQAGRALFNCVVLGEKIVVEGKVGR